MLDNGEEGIRSSKGFFKRLGTEKEGHKRIFLVLKGNWGRPWLTKRKKRIQIVVSNGRKEKGVLERGIESFLEAKGLRTQEERKECFRFF